MPLETAICPSPPDVLLTHHYLALSDAEGKIACVRALGEFSRTLQRLRPSTLNLEDSETLITTLIFIRDQKTDAAWYLYDDSNRTCLRQWVRVNEAWFHHHIENEMSQGRIAQALEALEAVEIIEHRQKIAKIYRKYRGLIGAGLKSPYTAKWATRLNNRSYAISEKYACDPSGELVIEAIDNAKETRPQSVTHACDLIGGIKNNTRTEKIIHAIARRFGIVQAQEDAFVNGWMVAIDVTTNRTNDANLLNLRRMFALERAIPGSVRTLNERFHLVNFGKYSQSVLLKQMESLAHPEAAYVLVCTNMNDVYNPQENLWLDNVYDILPPEYYIRVMEISNVEPELYALCKELQVTYGDPESIVFSSHGTEARLYITEEQLLPPHRVEQVVDIFTTTKHVAFHACLAGQPDGLAQRSSELVQTTIFSGNDARDNITSVRVPRKTIHGIPKLPFVLLFFEEGDSDRDCVSQTRFYLNGETIQVL